MSYIELLRELGKQKDMKGQIFTKAQNKIQDPAKLFRLIDMIDSTQWIMMGADVKGVIYEGLLEKNTEETKSGAGQYFTPRALIRAVVKCVRPETMALYEQRSSLSLSSRHVNCLSWCANWRRLLYPLLLSEACLDSLNHLKNRLLRQGGFHNE